DDLGVEVVPLQQGAQGDGRVGQCALHVGDAAVGGALLVEQGAGVGVGVGVGQRRDAGHVKRLLGSRRRNRVRPAFLPDGGKSVRQESRTYKATVRLHRSRLLDAVQVLLAAQEQLLAD